MQSKPAGRAIVCAAALLVLVGWAEASQAQARSEQETQLLLEKRNYARGGYYLALAGLWALENSDRISGPSEPIDTGGMDLRLGARHNRHLATEINALWVHHLTGTREDFFSWGVGIAERIYLTGRRVQPYAVLGAGMVQIRSSGVDAIGNRIGFSPRFGVGVDFYVNESWAVTLDGVYNMTVGGIEDHDFVTVGLGFQVF